MPTAPAGLGCGKAHATQFKRQDGAGGKGSEWELWGRELLEKTLESAPLDFGQVWGVALRYGLHWLAKRSIEGFESLLDLICKPVSAGTSQIWKGK